jgi:nitrate/nitrite transporter NarK
MTDYEAASLFADYLNTVNMVFSNYMAVLVAMISASYFLAHRMGRWVAALFLVIYTFVALQTGMGVFFAFTDFSNLGYWIHETRQIDPGDLVWLGPVGESGAGIRNMPLMVAFMVVGSYLGSIAFFFVVRANRIHKDGAPPKMDRQE